MNELARPVFHSGLRLPLHHLSSRLDECVSLSLGLGLASITFDTGVIGEPARLVLLGSSLLVAGLALLGATLAARTPVPVSARVALGFFSIGGIQACWRGEATNAVLAFIALFLTFSATRVDLPRLTQLIHTQLALIAGITMAPILLGGGFEPAERTWLEFLPGRYFGWSNANALGFIASVLILLSLPLGSIKRRHLGLAAGAALFALTASFTALIGIAVGVTAYYLGRRVRPILTLQLGVLTLATLTVTVLPFVHTTFFITALTELQERVHLSSRTQLWVDLVQRTSQDGALWFGVGNETLGDYAFESIGVATAHSAILQVLLSGGYVLAVLFVLTVALVTLDVLGRQVSSTSPFLTATLALIAYWFVASLVSSVPVTPIGMALLTVLAAASIPRPDCDESRERLAVQRREQHVRARSTAGPLHG